MQFTEQFDVVVVGAGHAGCEAAMASARMGLKTALYTLNVDLIAQMSCNPAIGGIAKGHLVREVDALGGIMGEVTDAVGIQFRLLNTSRGPAVWSPRAQCDKQQYRLKMREVLESEPNLHVKQAEVAELVLSDQWPVASDGGHNESTNSHQPLATGHCCTPGTRCEAARWPRGWREGSHHHDRHLSQRPNSLRRTTVSCGPQWRAAGRSVGRGAEESWTAWLPFEDRHAPAARRPQHRLVKVRRAAR